MRDRHYPGTPSADSAIPPLAMAGRSAALDVSRSAKSACSSATHDALSEYAQLAADGRFSIPVARVFPSEDWREAAELSQSGHARGKLILQIGSY